MLSVSGVGAGEGLAAVCGHQFGVKGIRAAMPAFSREIEAIEHQSFRFPAPTPFSFRARGTPVPVFGARGRAQFKNIERKEITK